MRGRVAPGKLFGDRSHTGARRRAAGVAVTIGLVLAACSNEDEPAARTEATVEDTEADRTDPPDDTEPEAPEAVLPFGSDESIPFDDQVVTGTLDNGLTYFIMQNDRPGQNAELRLAINAGSSLEGPDQSGVAHFLEHMLFNGTEKYDKNELIEVLQQSGSSFGADINAYTSYDETVYQLGVDNTDDELTLGLDILHEWLTAATIDPDQVIAERGVVLDEYRTRELTDDGRIFSGIESLYLDGTAYEGRSPIGLETAIEEMTAEPLRRFYDDWYRPDNAAVIVVGDINVDDIEARIEDIFGDAESRGDSPERPDLGWEGEPAPEAAVLTDSDVTSGFAEIAFPTQLGVDPGTIGARELDLVTYIAMLAIANRMNTDVVRGDAPFNNAQPSSTDIVRPLDAPSVYLTMNNADVADGATALLDEMARVLQFGVTDADVERAVEEVRASVDSQFDSSDTVQDAQLAGGLVEYFLTGLPFPNADDDYEISTELLDDIDADQVNEMIRARYAVAPPIMVLAAKDDVTGLPEADELESALAELEDRDVDDREAAEPVGDALMAAPEPVAVVDQSTIPGRPDFYIDPIEITLENGVRVIINQTDIVDDYVEFFAVSPGGFSVTDPADAPAVWLMNEVNSESGFGPLDAVAVEQILGSTTVDLFPYPSSYGEFLGGSSSPGDLELAMQAINRYFAASNFDQAALDRAVERNLGYIEDIGADPDLATQIALYEARYGDDPRFRAVLPEDELTAITTEQLERVWDERFGNAADFVFVFSGDLDVDATIDLAARYLGTLPASDEREVAVDVAAPVPPGIVRTEVRAGTGDTAQLVVQYETPIAGTASDRILADLLTAVLNDRLTERIREALGASYSPSAFVEIEDTPAGARAVTTFYISGAPADMATIAEVLQTDLADLLASGPTGNQMSGATAATNEEYGLISNEEIIETLVAWVDNPDAIEDYADAFDDVVGFSADDVKAFAAVVLPPGQYIEITQLPR